MAGPRAALLLAGLLLGGAAHAAEYRAVPGGELRSVLPPGAGMETVTVAPYALRETPVTNGEFLAFVTRHPGWRRGEVPALFADRGYLEHWSGPLSLGAAAPRDAPVINVSWYAARAFCESEEARLPTWYEWELAAAADETRPDARHDPAFRQRMLDWYARPATAAPPLVKQGSGNLYGIHDLHASVWEWVDDFNSLLVSADNREQGDPDVAKFCGAGALSVQDRESYAVLMRIAMLSSLRAGHTTRSLGFRCARDIDGTGASPGGAP
jgi:formylglycine-generating enzyme required for sulfatase activity